MYKSSITDFKKIDDVEVSYDRAKTFFHCKHCIDLFLGSSLHQVMSPRDYGSYEASTYDFTHPDGRGAMIVVIWCKRCGRKVWDSRHLE